MNYKISSNGKFYIWKDYSSECIEYCQENKDWSIAYLRFGELPNNEKSTNYLTQKLETGVSVYHCYVCEDEIVPILPNLNSLVTLSGCLQRQAFLVMGIQNALGSDGEPLLRSVVKIRNVSILPFNI